MDRTIKKILKKEEDTIKSTKGLLKADKKQDKKMDRCDSMMKKKK